MNDTFFSFKQKHKNNFIKISNIQKQFGLRDQDRISDYYFLAWKKELINNKINLPKDIEYLTIQYFIDPNVNSLNFSRIKNEMKNEKSYNHKHLIYLNHRRDSIQRDMEKQLGL